MKLEINSHTLQPSLLKISRIAVKHPALPVLNSIFISAGKTTLTLKATNLDLGVEHTHTAKIITEGSAAIPAGIFSSFLTPTKEAHPLSLSIQDGAARLTLRQRSATIHTIPHEDFPVIPKLKNTQSITLRVGEFIRGARAVVFAASQSTIKPELSSVFIEGSDGKITFAATDAFRLAEKTIQTPHIRPFGPLLIPIKNTNDILSLLEGEAGALTLSWSDTQLALTVGGMYITSRLVDGIFPDYHQIIPKTFSSQATLLKEDFARALKTTSVFSDRFNQTTLSLTPTKKQLTITTQTKEIGLHTETLDATLEGEALTITLNHRYLADTLPSITTDSVVLCFAGEGKPVVVRGVGDPLFLYLVMPMNTPST